MADEALIETAAPAPGEKKGPRAVPFLVLLADLAVPGLGHVWLRRWGRGILFLVAVGGLALCGFLMRGQEFTAASGDSFGRLGFVADACSGVFYLLSKVFEAAGPNLSRAAGDYGTRFLAAAGIVNLIAALDAYAIAHGRRG
ncbi:MAG TPA: DUF6677 family protein [Candidatus Aquilonibacter sp.]|nr:DUF6677 family protein [Candidatus Aquilonibacter sp.]